MADEEKLYRQLSAGMREELKQIYHQISSASIETGQQATTALFNEASSQLDEVVRTTEDATLSIMDIVEEQTLAVEEGQKLAQQINAANSTEASARLCEILESLSKALMNVITALSFQDITGQRLRKVADALASIEKSVRELYISSGLIFEAAGKEQIQDMKSLENAAKTAVMEFEQQKKERSALKGPDKNGITQSAIDDMLSQLGL